MVVASASDAGPAPAATASGAAAAVTSTPKPADVVTVYFRYVSLPELAIGSAEGYQGFPLRVGCNGSAWQCLLSRRVWLRRR